MKQFCLTLLLVTSLCTCVLAQGTRARAEVRLDEVYQTYNLTGEGTLVVMIDRGIDYHHPAYLKPDGTTRLAYVFDMINGDDGNAYGVGQVLDEDDINGDLMTDGPPLSNDNHGHGTATTGIIAGNGDGANNDDFTGVAPEATIISIKLVQDGFPAAGGAPGEVGFFNPDYIAIALQFARDKIEELGLPSVTLMNIGSIGGPTDGTSTIGRAIADFAANYSFVCGVGDDGGADNVARGNVNQTGNAAFTDIRFEKLTPGNMDVDLWYSDSDRFDIGLILPDGSEIRPPVPQTPQGRTFLSRDNISIWHNGPDADFFGATSDRREFFTRISEGTGIYTLRLFHITVNDGDFIATMNPSHFGLNNKFLDFGSNEGSINDYSASPGVISPGDYVFAPTYPSIDGNTYGGGQGAPGELWFGSSQGPTQDDRLGIDFAAPGEVLFGPYSPGSFYSRFSFSRVAGGNDLYGIQNAVSAAAPLTTGIIALMLERDPTLTPAEILTILQQTARSDNFTGTTPNNAWGHGKLDAKAALDEVERLTSTDNPQTGLFTARLHPNPVSDRLQLDLPLGLLLQEATVVDVVGRELLRFDGKNVADGLRVTALRPGAYFLRLRSGTGVVVKRFVKR